MGQRLTCGPRPRTPAAQGSAWQVPGRCGGTQAAGGARGRGAEQPLGRPEGVVNSRPQSPEAAACGHRASSVPRGGHAARARRSLTPSSPAGHSAHGTGSAHQPGAAEAAGQLAPSPGSARGLEEPPPLSPVTTRAGRPPGAAISDTLSSGTTAGLRAAPWRPLAALDTRPAPRGPARTVRTPARDRARGQRPGVWSVCVSPATCLDGCLRGAGGQEGGPLCPCPGSSRPAPPAGSQGRGLPLRPGRSSAFPRWGRAQPAAHASSPARQEGTLVIPRGPCLSLTWSGPPSRVS